MQNLIPFPGPDNLLHQCLSIRLFRQVIKAEEKPAPAFVAQSHVPRCFIQVGLKTTVPDTRLFCEQIGKYFDHQILRLVGIMQIAIDVQGQRVTVFSH